MPIRTDPQSQGGTATDAAADSPTVVLPSQAERTLRARDSFGVLRRALNITYDRTERRGFMRARLAAIAMLVCIGVALVLAFGLLVLGPQASEWVGSATSQPAIASWAWWTLEWPVLVGVLLIAFG